MKKISNRTDMGIFLWIDINSFAKDKSQKKNKKCEKNRGF